MSASRGSVVNLLHRYRPADPTEAADVARVLALAQTAEDAWARALPLHLTGSAVIVHPDSARVLLRWHPRQLSWLQVGGHGDPGETDAFDVAVREGREETGLADLVAWPAPGLIHLAVVAVPANDREPAHEHADLRFVLATKMPEALRPESPDAPVRWFTVPDALIVATEVNVQNTLSRVERLFAR